MRNQTKNTVLMVVVFGVSVVGMLTCSVALGLCKIDRLPRLRAMLTRFNHWVSVRIYMLVQFQRIYALTHTGE